MLRQHRLYVLESKVTASIQGSADYPFDTCSNVHYFEMTPRKYFVNEFNINGTNMYVYKE